MLRAVKNEAGGKRQKSSMFVRKRLENPTKLGEEKIPHPISR
jgi:hypothetical protein